MCSDLEQRNKAAHQVITSYAVKHAAMDVGIGLAGLIPIPGAATAALISAILAQAPLVYRPMTRELATIYNSSPDAHTDKMVTETVEMGALADVGVEFIKEIATDLISEAAAGLALTAIPFVGGLLAAGLDATIAATLTWRVGTMIAAYYQNGGEWIKSRKNTYSVASETVGSFLRRPVTARILTICPAKQDNFPKASQFCFVASRHDEERSFR